MRMRRRVLPLRQNGCGQQLAHSKGRIALVRCRGNKQWEPTPVPPHQKPGLINRCVPHSATKPRRGARREQWQPPIIEATTLNHKRRQGATTRMPGQAHRQGNTHLDPGPGPKRQARKRPRKPMWRSAIQDRRGGPWGRAGHKEDAQQGGTGRKGQYGCMLGATTRDGARSPLPHKPKHKPPCQTRLCVVLFLATYTPLTGHTVPVKCPVKCPVSRPVSDR